MLGFLWIPALFKGIAHGFSDPKTEGINPKALGVLLSRYAVYFKLRLNVVIRRILT